MTHEFAYHLATWRERDKQLLCPQCHKGRGCFKEYLRPDGRPVDEVNHLCGKCDHETTCGYHLSPSEFFKMNPEQRTEMTFTKVERKPKKMLSIDQKWLGLTARCYEQNNFVQWLRTLPLNDIEQMRMEKALKLYVVGTTQDGGTIWWQIDENLTVRTGKKMLYGADGHRRKDSEGNSIGFGWMHNMVPEASALLKEGTHEMMQCLFGQHLLKYFPDAQVHIVESEKSALLMNIFDCNENHIWMACGGLYNMTEAKLRALKDRKIVCYPDTNGVDRWKEAVGRVPGASLSTKWMTKVTDDDPKGADIADVMLRRCGMSKEARLMEMERKNNSVKTLVDNLKLTII